MKATTGDVGKKLTVKQVNPQLKGHLKGALNLGATVEEVRGVRDAVVSICEAVGMRRLDDSDELERLEDNVPDDQGTAKNQADLNKEPEPKRRTPSRWGWTEEVAKL